jgi:hypothetical protein
MLLVLHVFLIVFFIGTVIHCATHKKSSYDDRAFGYSVVTIILSVILLIVILVSYGNYVGMREYIDSYTLQHDLKALEALSSTVEKGDELYAESKDGYYEGLANGIFVAKERINNYNQEFISKKLLGRNFFLGLYIIEPDDDMKLIDVSKYNYNLGE